MYCLLSRLSGGEGNLFAQFERHFLLSRLSGGEAVNPGHTNNELLLSRLSGGEVEQNAFVLWLDYNRTKRNFGVSP